MLIPDNSGLEGPVILSYYIGLGGLVVYWSIGYALVYCLHFYIYITILVYAFRGREITIHA